MNIYLFCNCSIFQNTCTSNKPFHEQRTEKKIFSQLKTNAGILFSLGLIYYTWSRFRICFFLFRVSLIMEMKVTDGLKT
jgi:hypothetical protein